MRKTITALVLVLGLSLSLVGCAFIEDLLYEDLPEQEEPVPVEATIEEPATDEVRESASEASEEKQEETVSNPELENRPNATLGTGEIKWLSEGDVAPDFTVDLVGGETFTLSDYDDSTVFINFWATWCPPCRSSIPEVEKLYEEYKDNEDFIILGINMGEAKNEVEKFLKKNKMKCFWFELFFVCLQSIA